MRQHEMVICQFHTKHRASKNRSNGPLQLDSLLLVILRMTTWRGWRIRAAVVSFNHARDLTMGY